MKTLRKRSSATEKKTGNAKPIAICGILAALCVVLLYIGSLTVFDLTAVVVCALITMVVVVELGNKYAWIMVCAAGVLSLVLVPVKLSALMYILIGGIYPIVKAWFEQFRNLFAWPLKLSAMGTMLLVLTVVSEVFYTAEETYFILGFWPILIGLVFLVVYDLALTGCITVYIVKLRNRLGLKKLF